MEQTISKPRDSLKACGPLVGETLSSDSADHFLFVTHDIAHVFMSSFYFPYQLVFFKIISAWLQCSGLKILRCDRHHYVHIYYLHHMLYHISDHIMSYMYFIFFSGNLCCRKAGHQTSRPIQIFWCWWPQREETTQ